MASKRVAAKSPATAPSPILNALAVGGAVASSLALLVGRGWVGWPPHQLLASLYTISGCLALVGPLVLARSESTEGSLGELLWMAGGLLIWVNDAAALAGGHWRTASWVNPLDHRTMGLTVLAVLLAGWRCRLGGWNWSWTNVLGSILGLFWVGMALASWVPARVPVAGLR